MTICQAQAENQFYAPVNEGLSGYWYLSTTMSGQMCLSSCLKYNFVYAAINP